MCCCYFRCGNICKPTVGGDKAGLLYTMLREVSSNAAAVLLNRVAKLSARWIGDRGFSIGIDDVTPTRKVNEVKAALDRAKVPAEAVSMTRSVAAVTAAPKAMTCFLDPSGSSHRVPSSFT